MLRTARPGLRQRLQRQREPTIGGCGKAHPIDEPGWGGGSRNPNAKPWTWTSHHFSSFSISLHLRLSLGWRLRVVLGGPGPGQGAKKRPTRTTHSQSLHLRLDPRQSVEGLGEGIVEGWQAVCPPDLSKKINVCDSHKYSGVPRRRPEGHPPCAPSAVCSASPLPTLPILSSGSQQRQATTTRHGFRKARCLRQVSRPSGMCNARKGPSSPKPFHKHTFKFGSRKS